MGTEGGKLLFANANPHGAEGRVQVLSARFRALRSGRAGLSLKFSALAAAKTFIDLLPYLQIVESERETVSLLREDDSPASFALENYPNPFNPATEIRYQLPQAATVEMAVYNLLGQKVQTLVNEKQAAGHYRLRWEGRNAQGQPLPAGVYFLRMRAGSFVAERKLLLLK